MNKVELTSAVAEKMNIAKKDAATYVDTVLDTIMETVEAHEKVSLSGFGVFEARETKARTGETNGVKWSKEDGFAPKFRASKAFKERV
ncbi:HU family DNA-binding protein [Anaerovorax sp. IOR16]|uniref:HU family DNA-binding protein n=1 Tax=Anaerovorax sp. IOR16 TaxID=2773458 RepID=UPI0019D2110C|nr:HU family DNA-binding protein [Anaerovorax sp. IOR16]